MSETFNNLPPNESMGDLDAALNALKIAGEHGLEAEVIVWALYHASTHPEASVEECLSVGMIEWDVL